MTSEPAPPAPADAQVAWADWWAGVSPWINDDHADHKPIAEDVAHEAWMTAWVAAAPPPPADHDPATCQVCQSGTTHQGISEAFAAGVAAERERIRQRIEAYNSRPGVTAIPYDLLDETPAAAGPPAQTLNEAGMFWHIPGGHWCEDPANCDADDTQPGGTT